MIPRWYRTARLAGAAAIFLAAMGFVGSYPFVAGEPESFATSDEPDPVWFRPLAAVCLVLVVVGLLLLLLPFAHRALRRR